MPPNFFKLNYLLNQPKEFYVFFRKVMRDILQL